jgi:hypothetical protein
MKDKTARLAKADRFALEQLWPAGAGQWAADTWEELNGAYFGGTIPYHGIVWGLTPHGSRLGHTSEGGRITLHPALLDPANGMVWDQPSALYGNRYARDVLLHEMVHVGGAHGHNSQAWCDEVVRITPLLGLPPVQAEPVKPRRISGKVKRQAQDGYLDRKALASWPHSLRPADYYLEDNRKLHVEV